MAKTVKRQPETELADYYARFDEKNRLYEGVGKLELARTKEIIKRYLQPPPAVVYDIGGAAGVYSLWLAREGYSVHLVDPIPNHIEQATHASQSQSKHPVASCSVGDARCLDFPDESADAMLLLGPMYHLTDLSQRQLVLRESVRVLRPCGTVFVGAISRFASVLDGLIHGFLMDQAFVEIVKQDLSDGQHRNPTGNTLYFTDAVFHHPEELLAEIESVDLHCEKVLPVESLGGLLQNFDEHWCDDTRRARLLEALRWLEEEPSLLGASPHIIAVAEKTAR
jgi:ubiquinone/menaquinone biosynthesis C-methylase UbiE